MEKKNVVFLTVLAVATLLTAVVGTTFAYFTATVSGNNTVNETVITTPTLGVVYNDGTALATGTNITPGWSETKTITVKNTSGINVDYTINWTSVTNGFVAETRAADSCTDAQYTTSEACLAANKEWKTAGTENNFVYSAAVTSDKAGNTPAQVA